MINSSSLLAVRDYHRLLPGEWGAGPEFEKTQTNLSQATVHLRNRKTGLKGANEKKGPGKVVRGISKNG